MGLWFKKRILNDEEGDADLALSTEDWTSPPSLVMIGCNGLLKVVHKNDLVSTFICTYKWLANTSGSLQRLRASD